MSGLPPEQRAGFSPEQNFFRDPNDPSKQNPKGSPFTNAFSGFIRKGAAEGTLKGTKAPAPKAPSEPPASAAPKGRVPSGKRARKHNVRRG